MKRKIKVVVGSLLWFLYCFILGYFILLQPFLIGGLSLVEVSLLVLFLAFSVLFYLGIFGTLAFMSIVTEIN